MSIYSVSNRETGKGPKVLLQEKEFFQKLSSSCWCSKELQIIKPISVQAKFISAKF